MNVAGQPEFFQRLVYGFAPQMQQALAAVFGDAARAQTAIDQVRAFTELRSLVWDAMPVQDAIDLADFVVDGTKRLVRFLPGHDTVSGETDIAVITKHEGFKWVRRKHYFPVSLNPVEVSNEKNTGERTAARRRQDARRG